MSDLFSKIQEDLDDYLQLCKKYSVEPEMFIDDWGSKRVQCYGEHASMLRKRDREERKNLR